MPASSSDKRLKVALLGRKADLEDWAHVLSGRPVEIIEAPHLEGLLDSQPDLAVVCVDPEGAARVTNALAARQEVPPVTLLVRSDAEAHPHMRLLKVLAQAKQDWEGAFDAISDPVVILDRNGAVTRANLALGRTLQRPMREVIGLHYLELLGRSHGFEDPVAESLGQGRAQTREARYAGLHGVQQITTSPLTDSKGEPRGLVVILKDVTELKEQQERMLQTARLADIGQLAAGVAHEINTPLASIALRAESLLKAAEDPPLQALESFQNFPRYLKTINDEVFRCKKIISALLEFSRAWRPEVREIDLNALCEKAADLVGHQMRLRQVALSLQLQPGSMTVKGDEGQLRQVVIALLVNALDATSPGGHVSIATRQDPGGPVALTVSDDGVGIPREHLDRIFSPFFTTKAVGKGTGLGLAVCHGVVSAHGGEIRVESELNRGTRVFVLLPPHGAAGGPAGGDAFRHRGGDPRGRVRCG